MNFIIFRHGEKQNFEIDSSLSVRGQNQAQNIVQLVEQKKLPLPTKIFTSPKKRAIQTLTPLSLFSKLKINPTPLLDIKGDTESQKDFRLRVQEFLVSFQLEEIACLYICTHHDWVEEFLSVIECSTDLLAPKYIHWASGQYMYFEKSDIWHLLEFKQA